MAILLTIIHILVCLFLIVVVLLQSGKAADLAGAFGGMGSQTTFGPRGSATALSRATTVAAALFMLTSLFLTVFATRAGSGTGSVLEKNKPQPVRTAPAKPATPQGPSSVSVGGQTIPLTPNQGQAPAQGKAPAQQPAPAPAAPAKK